MRLLVALPVAVALASTPAMAEDKPASDDKIICKRAENYVTGTRLSQPKKVCKKSSEWKQTEDEKNRTMRGLQDGRAGAPDPGGPPRPGG